MFICVNYLSQTLVQDPGLGSDHTEGQMPAPYPPFHGLDEGDLGGRMMIKTLRRANMMRCSIQMPMLMTELNRQKDGLKSHWPGVVSG